MEGIARTGKTLKRKARAFLADESGMATLEYVLLLVIVIGLVLLFRTRIQEIAQQAFESITSGSGDIISTTWE